MQKVNLKLLLTLIVTNISLYAQEYDFTVGADIISELKINTDSQWAINGGVFKHVNDGIKISAKGKHQLLIMSDKNEVQTYLINITNGVNDAIKNNMIYVDNTGPEIATQWHNIVEDKGQIIVGKKSILTWQSPTDKSFSQQVFINNKELSIKNNRLTFDQKSEQIKLVLSDSFGNSTATVLNVKSDFEGPVIDWRLAPSNIPNNNERNIAGKYADIIIDAKDVSGIKEYSLDGKIIPENNEMKVKNNSTIRLTDGLGNTTSQKIAWNIDKDKPQIKIQANNQEYINKKLIKIKVNALVTISVFDKGAGIKSAYYFSKHKEWLKLPKTFELLGPRRYKVRIMAEDNSGNKIKTHVTLKARR